MCASIVARGFLALCGVLIAACATHPIGGPVEPGELGDGAFEGRYGDPPHGARVRVLIDGGCIRDVELLEHGGWIRNAEGLIEARIVEDQSTGVDVVTGATQSSHVIMNAAERAVEESRAEARAEAR